MQKRQSSVARDLRLVLGDLHREFGTWKMALALIRAAWEHHRMAAANDVADLSPQMRRDIGLADHLHDNAVRLEERCWEHWR